ncbi:MAG: thiamine diphosphokinase [Oscillospiraceae bacterium]|nr:thiamine diphosphokinase [Oscillospiraceae bacterium]
MKTAVIFSGGAFSMPEWVQLPKEAIFLCADSGLRHARALGIKPDWILGDFDSSSEVPDGKNVLRYPPEKDDTDTMLAVKLALSMGAQEIQIYGGLGGRFDHAIANVQVLRYLTEQGAIGTLCDAQNWMTIQTGGTIRQYPKRLGWYFSLLSLSDVCTGVTVRGTRYTLEKGILSAGIPLGVSNEIIAEQAEVSFEQGALLVLYTRDAL